MVWTEAPFVRIGRGTARMEADYGGVVTQPKSSPEPGVRRDVKAARTWEMIRERVRTGMNEKGPAVAPSLSWPAAGPTEQADIHRKRIGSGCVMGHDGLGPRLQLRRFLPTLQLA